METCATVFLLSLASFGLYSSTLWADFVYDDSRAILSNDDLRSHTPWSKLFTDDYWGVPLQHSGSHKSYRPLTVATFRLNYILAELQPFGYHLVNVLLHCLVTVQVWVLARKFLKRVGSIFCGALFAVHPIHTEAVAGVVGRADILATVLVLLALEAYWKHAKCRTRPENLNSSRLWLTLTICCSIASMLCKEHGITVLGVCVIYDLLLKSRFALSDLFGMRFVTQEKFKSSRWSISVLICAGIGCVAFRLWIMGFQAPNFSPSDNPTAHCDSFFTRLATFCYLAAFNAKLLVIPELLSFDWSMEAIPRITSLFDIRNCQTLLVFAIILCLGRRLSTAKGSYPKSAEVLESAILKTAKSAKRRSPSPKFDMNANRIDSKYYAPISNNNNNNNNTINRNISFPDTSCSSSSTVIKNGYKLKFKGSNLNLKSSNLHKNDPKNDAAHLGLVILVLTFLPATNLFAYVGFVVAERVLYLPSVGYCLLIAAGWEKLYGIFRSKTKLHTSLFKFGSVIFLAFLAGKTWHRNYDWLDEESLYSSGITTNPAKSYSNLGNVYSRQKRFDKAERAYNSALEHRPNMADTHYNLGTLLQETGRFDQAVRAYENAIQYRSRLAVAHLNLGLTLWTLGKISDAIKRFETCSDLSSEGLKDPKAQENAKLSCLYNLGRLFAEQGQVSKAITVYRSAVQRMNQYYPSRHSLYNMMGEAYGKLGQLDEAERWFKQALSVKPDHVPAHLTYGHLLLRKGQNIEARQWFQKAVSIAPEDPSTWYHFGQFYQHTEDYNSALSAYTKAYNMDKRNFDATFAMANVYRQLSENIQAENFYESAVSLNPMSANARMNYGAMLHLNKKYDQAEVQYLKSLELSPGDEVTEENLKKLRRVIARNKSET